jgi:hypothetical protein
MMKLFLSLLALVALLPSAVTAAQRVMVNEEFTKVQG